MDIEVARRPAARDRAAVVVAREHLAAKPRCDGGRHTRRFVRVERADQLGVAPRAVEHLGADLDLAPGAVLPATVARFAHGERDLICRTLGACPGLERTP